MLDAYYLKYHEETGGEENRLHRDAAHSIEYRTSLHFLSKYLPLGCSVLDSCAGAGVYSFPLSRLGYKVTAGDLMQFHVDIINKHPDRNLLCDVYCGDVLDMSQFADESFDTILCMGALYHLQTKTDREKCVAECLRVLRPGGIFAFSYINRYAIFINHFKYNACDFITQKSVIENGNNDVFYGMDFSEVDRLVDKFGLLKLTDVGVDGLMYPLHNELNSINDEQFEEFMKIHLQTCEQPSIIGNSMHGLWIGKKEDI